MTRLVLSSDLHLGHKNICKYRSGFEDAEDHHEFVLTRHKLTINKNDTWVCLGDAAFTEEWLYRLNEIKCRRKVLLLGNHDVEKLHVRDFMEVFDDIQSLQARKSFGVKYWLSHAPVHPDEMRGKKFNIHGHTHDHIIQDPRYVNVCVEHTNYGVVSVEEVLQKATKRMQIYDEINF